MGKTKYERPSGTIPVRGASAVEVYKAKLAEARDANALAFRRANLQRSIWRMEMKKLFQT